MKPVTLFSMVIFSVAAFCAATELMAAELAKVGSESISVEEFISAANTQEENLGRALEADEKKALLNAMVNQRLLVSEAKRRKYQKEEDFKSAIEFRERELLTQALLLREIAPSAKVSEEELEKFYKENQSLFHTVTYQQILLQPKSKETKLATKVKAEELKKKANSKNFGDLARKYSDDKISAERGGVIGPIRFGMLVTELEEKIFGAKEGSYLLLESRYGYHVILVKEHRIVAYKEAAAALRQELETLRFNSRQNDFLQELLQKHKVRIREDRLP